MKSPRGSVLLADDEEGILKTLGRALREEGHDVTATASASEAQRLLSERSFDVFVVDNRMPGRTGLEIIRDLAAAVPEGERPQVLMMTAHATVENAIEAMKLGAYDYLQKPFEVDELLVAVRRALEHQSLSRQNRYLLSEREEDFDHYGIVGSSRAVEELLRKIELVARAVHARSAQHEMPLIKVNCAAIPEALLESELFGHVKGAFTGAIYAKKGLFKLADKGTLFFDEIGNIPMETQAKLLRVIQEREFMRLGGIETVKVDVRVVAATNVDLRRAVEAGRFREDLYYRLNVIAVQLPPLRQRKEDVPALAQHFIDKYARENGKDVEGVTPEALQVLMDYDWPGNVRELENVIERGVVLTTGPMIGKELVPEQVRSSPGFFHIPPVSVPPEGINLREVIAGFERRIIESTLETTGGVQKDAARLLGLKPTTLNEMIKRHSIPLPRDRERRVNSIERDEASLSKPGA